LSPEIINPFPKIPLDVAGLIFQFSADEDKDDAISLMQVSKLVHKFVKSVLYRNPIIGKKQANLFSETMNTTNLGIHVRRLYIPSITVAIIRGCPNLQVLFAKTLMPEKTESLPEDLWPSPWLIVCVAQADNWETKMQASIPKTIHPLFRKVTHLVVNPVDIPILANLPSRALPCLQYLAIDYTVFTEYDQVYIPLISKILTSFSQLRVLLLVECHERTSWNGIGSWKPFTAIDDPRFFARFALTEREYEDIMYGGPTMWDDAENRYRDWRKLIPALGEAK
jgi:hypothetical protein